MSTTVSAPLNPEPADPKERAEHYLPAKSFAEAVQNPAPGSNGDDSQNHSPNHTSYASSAATAVDHKERQQQLDEDKIAFENHVSADGQEVLTSVKPDDQYEESLKHDAETAPREQKKERPTQEQNAADHPLASGRKAGAGWQRSAYAPFTCLRGRADTSAASDGRRSTFPSSADCRPPPSSSTHFPSLSAFRYFSSSWPFPSLGLYLFLT